LKKDGPLTADRAVDLAEKTVWHSKIDPLSTMDLLAGFAGNTSHDASRFVDVADKKQALTEKYGKR
jgi:hypothetical protein